MPAPDWEIIATSVIEVRIIGELAGQRTMNVLHYFPHALEGGVDGTTALDALLDNMNAAGGMSILGRYAACTCEDFLIKKVQAQQIYSVRYLYSERTSVYATGDIAQESLPPNMAASLTLRSELADGGGHGRIQVPSVPVNAVAEGIIDVTHRDLLAELADDLIQDITAGGVTFRPFQFRRSLPLSRREYVAYLVQETIRDQRTRTVGKGV